jgi:hypothetical protein
MSAAVSRRDNADRNHSTRSIRRAVARSGQVSLAHGEPGTKCLGKGPSVLREVSPNESPRNGGRLGLGVMLPLRPVGASSLLGMSNFLSRHFVPGYYQPVPPVESL